jgi:hypothetical protein
MSYASAARDGQKQGEHARQCVSDRKMRKKFFRRMYVAGEE